MTTQAFLSVNVLDDLRNPTAYQIAQQFKLNDDFCQTFGNNHSYKSGDSYDKAITNRRRSIRAMYALAEIDSNVKQFMADNRLKDYEKMIKIYTHFKHQELWNNTQKIHLNSK